MKRVTPICCSLCLAFVLLVLAVSGCSLVPNSKDATSANDAADISISADLQEKWLVGMPKLLDLDDDAGTKPNDFLNNQLIESDDVEFPREKREFTIMVYMVGSDLETNSGCATADLIEMLRSGLDCSRFNLVVYTGGSLRWYADIPNNHNCVLEINENQARIVAGTLQSQNMGDPGTLSAFVTWAQSNYPADRSALIMWDHGQGPIGGYGFDQLFRFDSLTLAEMSQAMQDAGFGEDSKLDWVGFDACLMASMEVMQSWEPYANYIVASQDVESGYGWDYSFLGSFESSDDPREQVRLIVDAFGEFYDTGFPGAVEPNATLAAVDLTQFNALEETLDNLSEAVSDDISIGDFAYVARARGKCRQFGSVTDMTLVDLVDFAKRLENQHPIEVAQLLETVGDVVVANTSNIEGANGISLYFPHAQKSASYLAPTEGIQRMLAGYIDRVAASQQVDWSGLSPAWDGDDIVLELRPDQASNLASASYSVLSNYNGRGWLPIMSDIAVDVDDEGTLKVQGDPVLVCTAGGTDLVPLQQIDANSDRMVFICKSAALSPGADFVDPPYGEKSIDINLAVDMTSNTVNVVSVSPSETGEIEFGRNDVALSDYRDLRLPIQHPTVVRHGDDGGLLPCDEWDVDSDISVWNQVAINGSLDFETCRLSECEGSYALQICAVDINGKKHASEIIELNASDAEVLTVETDSGTMYFSDNGDHVELTSYLGSDKKLVVPGEVEGKQVRVVRDSVLSSDWSVHELVLPSTVQSIGAKAFGCHNLEKVTLPDGLERIGDGAFSSCYLLDQINLPDGVTFIGRRAFSASGIENVFLPESITHVGDGAFTACTSLQGFEVAEGCDAVCAVDGALYSSGCDKLIAFPAGRSGSFSVQPGTSVVGYGAFAYTKLDTVSLPEGLTKIENCAFYCDGVSRKSTLSSIDLPESLEYVGAYAFGSELGLFNREEAPFVESLRIGKNVKHVGFQAFSGLRLGRFIVDADNLWFSSPGGLLANKAADTVLESPQGISGPVVVPDGITTLGDGVFSLYPNGTDFILPASLSRISAKAFPYRWSTDTGAVTCDIRLHGEPGSAAEAFALNKGIPFDNVTDPKLFESELVTQEQEGVVFEFEVFSNHASLIEVDASNARFGDALVIPNKVRGVCVTSIAGLEGSKRPFDAWSKVVLPESLESVDTRSLSFLLSSEGFAFESPNEYYSVVDGVLFSADGRELVAFALADPAFNDVDSVFSYSIPDGVKTIGRGAFRYSQLERVEFCSSVRTVHMEAFYGNDRLYEINLNQKLARVEDRAFKCPAESIELPSTLAYIGDDAFNLVGFDGLELPEKLAHLGSFCFYRYDSTLYDTGSTELFIDSSLSFIGQDSLSSLNVESFEVSSQNKYFSSIDGMLMSKDGSTLIRCPAGRKGELRLPDGVEVLDGACLEKARGLTDVFFPETVVSVDAYRSFDEGSAAAGVVFHCKRGSAAQIYAAAHGIKWVE